MAVEGSARVRLGDLVDVKHGWPFKSALFRQELTRHPIVVGIGNFNYTGGFRFESTAVKEYRGAYPREFELAPGDTLVVMTCQTPGGEILGIPARVPDDGRVYLHNQRMGKVVVKDPSRVSEDYLYWVFLSQDFNQHLVQTASGTKILHTAPGRIEAYELDLPPLARQRRIADILGTLDHKIELNRRTNETLEAIARALFKSWFVDFGPVRAKAERRDPGLPSRLADMFPESFDGSELGEIPTGWRAGVLADLAEHPRRGVQPDLVDPSTLYVGLEHMPRGRMVLDDWGGAGALESGKLKFRRGEILFGKLRPYFHKVGVAPIDGICSTDIVVIRPRTDPAFGLVLGIVSSDAFVDYAAAGSTGTRMPRTNWAEMAHFPCAIPPDQVMGSFTDQVRPAIDRVLGSIHESRALSALRDSLLPKLISGALNLKNVERLLEASR